MLLRTDSLREFNRTFEQIFGAAASRANTMPLDVYKVGNEVIVRLDLPGVKEEDIDITVERNMVTVKTERYFPDEQADVIVSERTQGSFIRQVAIGDSLDTENIDAIYMDGVLTLKIPVNEKSKPRRIQLGANGKAAIEQS